MDFFTSGRTSFFISPSLLSRVLPALFTALIVFFAVGQGSADAAGSDVINFTIIHTNDEHGALIPHSPAVDDHPGRKNPSVGGMARLATAVDQVRQEKKGPGEEVLLLSGGDFIGGTAFSWLATLGYAPELKLMQMIGYDAVVIGNHEYDYGPDVLAGYLQEAGYPGAHHETAVLASNTLPPADHLLVRNSLFKENVMITLDNGLRIGLFGLIGKDAVSVTTANEPVEFTCQLEAARMMVEELNRQGADIVIALTHSGVEEDRELALEVPGIDIIVGGHCHTALYEPVIAGETIIVQSGAHLEYFGRLELVFDRATGGISTRNEGEGVPFLTRLDHNYKPHPAVAAEIESYTGILNDYVYVETGGRFAHVLDDYVMLSDFVIKNYPPLQESPMGNFVTDAMRIVTGEKSEHDPHFAVQFNGAIRGSLVPGTMPHSFGKVSIYDLVLPVGLGMGADGSAGYPLAAVYLTGDEIMRVLEVAVLLQELMGDTYFMQVSGLRFEYDPQNAVLFHLPLVNMPLPTGMAVTRVQKYSGEGRQDSADAVYVDLEINESELYCLVTDTYILSFLPIIGEVLPWMDIIPRDRQGNPVSEDNLDQLIVRVDGKELKVWQAVVEYAADMPTGSSGLPEADPYYSRAAGRINPVETFPLLTWFVLAVMIIMALLFLIIFLGVRRRKVRLRG